MKRQMNDFLLKRYSQHTCNRRCFALELTDNVRCTFCGLLIFASTDHLDTGSLLFLRVFRSMQAPRNEDKSACRVFMLSMRTTNMCTFLTFLPALFFGPFFLPFSLFVLPFVVALVEPSSTTFDCCRLLVVIIRRPSSSAVDRNTFTRTASRP